jgi:hypothetical protein
MVLHQHNIRASRNSFAKSARLYINMYKANDPMIQMVEEVRTRFKKSLGTYDLIHIWIIIMADIFQGLPDLNTEGKEYLTTLRLILICYSDLLPDEEKYKYKITTEGNRGTNLIR